MSILERQKADEVDAISRMMIMAKRNSLEIEVIYSFGKAMARGGNPILAAAAALTEWDLL